MEFGPIGEYLGNALDTLGKGTGLLNSALDLIDRWRRGTEAPSEKDIDKLEGDIRKAELAYTKLETQLLQLQRAFEEARVSEQTFGKYELWETPAEATVYRIKATDLAVAEPLHYICPNCREDGRKSILQKLDWSNRTCLSCQSMFPFEPFEQDIL